MTTPNLVLDLPRIRRDARNGSLGVEELLDIIDSIHDENKRLKASNRGLLQRLEKYEPAAKTDNKNNANDASDAEKPNASATSFSIDDEMKRRSKKRQRKQKSPGRTPTVVKFAEADRVEELYPIGVRKADCVLARERAIWRIEDGKAVRVGYRIFAGPDGAEAIIPGVTPRCEYGIEVMVSLAFLIYIVGISFDKACEVMRFFCGLPLMKSQADALLRQLANHWEDEFDMLCDMIAQAAVVYMDETGWKVGEAGSSLWAFASELHKVFLFGCHKDQKTLDAMLPPNLFEGIGVSDDAAVYSERFKLAQKCWAHLLRKAIRLALQNPEEKSYQTFLDELLQLFHDAKRAASDGRLSAAGRAKRVEELSSRLLDLCVRNERIKTPEMSASEREFANLVEEISRLLLAEELFTFVLHPELVEATNNESERNLRGAALDRKAGRTNKTATGAHRRSVIVSVLESLRKNLEEFSLKSVLEEVTRWTKEGISLFAKQWSHLIGAEPTPDTT